MTEEQQPDENQAHGVPTMNPTQSGLPLWGNVGKEDSQEPESETTDTQQTVEPEPQEPVQEPVQNFTPDNVEEPQGTLEFVFKSVKETEELIRGEFKGETQLTENFKFRECLHSNFALGNDILNIPHSERLDEIIENAQIVADNILQPIRNYRGAPVFTTSWFRSTELNSYLGGSEKSYHLDALAVDITFGKPEENIALAYWCFHNLENFDKVIYEERNGTTWVHIQIRKDLMSNRFELGAYYKNKSYEVLETK